MKIVTSLVVLFLLAGHSSLYAELSLVQVTEAIVQQNPALQAGRWKIESAQYQAKEVAWQRAPHLSVRSSLTRGNHPVYVFGSLLEQRDFGLSNFAIDSLNKPAELTHIKNALDVGVPLFTGYALTTGQKTSQLQVQQSQQEQEGLQQQILLRSVELYLSALQHQQKEKLLKDRIESADREIDDARKLNARGLVLGSDFFAAQAVLSALKAQALQAQEEAQTARDQLCVMMGQPCGDVVLKGNLFSPDYHLNSEQVYLEQAFSTRRESHVSLLQQAMTDLQYQQSTRSLLPQIEAFASLETNTRNFDSNPSNHTIGVRSYFPLGDPAIFARRSKSKAEVRMMKQVHSSLREKIQAEVIHAYRRLRTAEKTRVLVATAVGESKKSLEMFRPLYREGRQSIFDVLRAEEGLWRAQEALLNNDYGLHLGYAHLHAAVGQLDFSAVKDIHAQLEKSYER